MVWIENYEAQQQELRDRIVAAQKLLPTVEIDYDLRVKISEVCSQLDVDGLRGDIVTNRAAKAHAAYNGRDKVTLKIFQNYYFMFTSSFKKRSIRIN
jgi:magnesium chelatase subunit I